MLKNDQTYFAKSQTYFYKIQHYEKGLTIYDYLNFLNVLSNYLTPLYA